jgi:hypothetical protein
VAFLVDETVGWFYHPIYTWLTETPVSDEDDRAFNRKWRFDLLSPSRPRVVEAQTSKLFNSLKKAEPASVSRHRVRGSHQQLDVAAPTSLIGLTSQRCTTEPDLKNIEEGIKKIEDRNRKDKLRGKMSTLVTVLKDMRAAEKADDPDAVALARIKLATRSFDLLATYAAGPVLGPGASTAVSIGIKTLEAVLSEIWGKAPVATLETTVSDALHNHDVKTIIHLFRRSSLLPINEDLRELTDNNGRADYWKSDLMSLKGHVERLETHMGKLNRALTNVLKPKVAVRGGAQKNIGCKTWGCWDTGIEFTIFHLGRDVLPTSRSLDGCAKKTTNRTAGNA